jgi:hypothetical protein
MPNNRELRVWRKMSATERGTTHSRCCSHVDGADCPFLASLNARLLRRGLWVSSALVLAIYLFGAYIAVTYRTATTPVGNPLPNVVALLIGLSFVVAAPLFYRDWRDARDASAEAQKGRTCDPWHELDDDPRGRLDLIATVDHLLWFIGVRKHWRS